MSAAKTATIRIRSDVRQKLKLLAALYQKRQWETLEQIINQAHEAALTTLRIGGVEVGFDRKKERKGA